MIPRLSACRCRCLLAGVSFICAAGLSGQEMDLSMPAGQPGTVSGTVVNTAYGTGLNTVIVYLDGTDYQTVTDVEGRYRLEDVAPGEYEAVYRKEGYQTARVEGVSVSSGEVTALNMALTREAAQQEEGIMELEEFVVTFEDVQTQDMKLLGQRQRAATVSDAIGSETFSRLSLGDAAEAMTKVTGASVVDDKYVLIRGLGDRYSNTLLNGANVPSADPDRRAVQMDQFPSDLLETIVTSKSFTPDQPGSFSGGSVNIKTKSFPEQFFLSVSSSVTWDVLASSQEVLRLPGGVDELASDSGRDLPVSVPEDLPDFNTAFALARFGNPESLERLSAFTQQFNNSNYIPERDTAGPDYGFSIAIGDSIDLAKDRLFGYTLSLTYDTGFTYFDTAATARYNFNPFTETVEPDLIYNPDISAFSTNLQQGINENIDVVEENFGDFGTTNSVESVNWGGFAKFAFKPSANHEVSLDIFHNQSAEDQIRLGVGEENRNFTGNLYQIWDLLYTERSVSTAQLNGKSRFGQADEWTLDWRASYSESTQEQPDYRTIISVYRPESDQFDQSNVPNPRRYFRDLEETSQEAAFDLTREFSNWLGKQAKFKVGAAYRSSERDYNEERLQWSTGIGAFSQLETFPGEVGITELNPPRVRGVVLSNLPSPNNYEGEEEVVAGYAMLDTPLTDRWRLIIGGRYETTDISVVPEESENIDPSPGRIDEGDFLPAVSGVFSWSENVNIRLAYGRTLARPTYKELSDIRTEDIFNAETYVGNADLVLTSIDNFDLRWEWFPRAGEIVAASVFYKDMKNPIEVVFDTSVASIQPQNVEEGTVTGIELEYRQDLDAWHESLMGWSFGANVAFIESEVSIPENERENALPFDPDFPETRQLLGQSDYTFNTDITYRNSDWGSVFTASFNVVGERLILVNPGTFEDVFEKPRPQLNFIYTQKLGSDWTLKFTAKNLLSPDSEKVIDFNGTELPYEVHETRPTFKLGLTYLFR
ncbi:MAG: TonB-dependent receptor domain-containing protein [Opitutales bacterium]